MSMSEYSFVMGLSPERKSSWESQISVNTWGGVLGLSMDHPCTKWYFGEKSTTKTTHFSKKIEHSDLFSSSAAQYFF